VRKELNKEWKKACSESITGSLDAKCFVYKREIEQSFTTQRLLEECQSAKSFAKHPSKIQRHPATNMILPDWHLMNPDSALVLFQPHLSVLVSKNMPHKHAHDLLHAYFTRNAKFASDKDSFSTIWVDFIAPWFNLPLRWNELGGTLRAKGPHAKLTRSQRVRTSAGDGEILSVIDRKGSDSFRYLVKFSFGVGYVEPRGVAHLLPLSSTTSDMDTSSDNTPELMQDDIQVLFGTEKVYILMRLYILLVTMLYQAKDIIDRKNITDQGEHKSGFSEVMSSLHDFVRGKEVDAKDFEAECRKSADNNMFNFVAIPPLVERFAEALVKVATEDYLEQLYHCSQLKLKDLNQLRNLSLDVTDEAIYRLQIQSSASQVFFSYLPLTNTFHANPTELTDSEDRPSSDLSDAKRPLEAAKNCAANNEAAAASAQKRIKTQEEMPKSESET